MGDMMKYVIKYFKKFIVSGFLIYGYNLIATTFNITIPINFFSLIAVTIFDFVGLTALVLIKIIGL